MQRGRMRAQKKTPSLLSGNEGGLPWAKTPLLVYRPDPVFSSGWSTVFRQMFPSHHFGRCEIGILKPIRFGHDVPKAGPGGL